MGRCVLRADQARDLYLVWSSNVDGPIFIGNREHVEHYLVTTKSPEPVAALDRADDVGSSDRTIKFGWWDDEDLPVKTDAPDDGWYCLPRGRLGEYADALLAEDYPAAAALLVCYQRLDADGNEVDG